MLASFKWTEVSIGRFCTEQERAMTSSLVAWTFTQKNQYFTEAKTVTECTLVVLDEVVVDKMLRREHHCWKPQPFAVDVSINVRMLDEQFMAEVYIFEHMKTLNMMGGKRPCPIWMRDFILLGKNRLFSKQISFLIKCCTSHTSMHS
ncbi:hypothetical protein XENOCAPTIV_005068 [Xenoophorus captivus]|uniref:Uncharacterized protein n=1 Tax=Xenoophorus captivus TaxID=1517983 RepID=A0ABV0SFD2_9TELE